MPADEQAAIEKIEATYSRWAFIYDTFTWLTETRSLERALSVAALRDGEAVLEVAVGTGAAFRGLLKANPSGRNVGVDLTEAMLRRARAKAERTGVPFDLRLADARSLPFGAGEFDLVMNNNMLGLVPRRLVEPIAAELFRVLRPRGRLAAVMMDRPKALFADAFYQLVVRGFGGWRELDIAPALVAAGFAIERTDQVTQLGVPSRVLLARKP